MPNILIWRGVYLNRMASQSLQQQKSVHYNDVLSAAWASSCVVACTDKRGQE